jgi:flagellar hook-associated protein 1 FlgK
MANLLDIGLSGLQAANYGLATTSNNIANASTAGYSEETVDYTAASGQYTSSGFLGSGVDTATVVRQYSAYLDTQLNQATSTASALSTYSSQASTLSSAVGNPTSGITTGLANFFNDLSSVASNPSSIATRQTAVSAAQTLASQFQALSTSFDQTRTGVNTQLTTTVNQINGYASQIASLNSQITAASATGQTPNTLLDQRDAAVASLSKLVGTSVVKASDGSESVFIGTGQSLVVGNQSFGLTTVNSPTDPSELTIAYAPSATTPATAPTQYLSESALQGGSLGGLLQFRSQVLDPEQSTLGTLATSFAVAVNQTNQQGIDLSGNAGTAIFSISNPTTVSGATNTGTGSLSAAYSDPSALTGDNYTITQNADGTYSALDTTTKTTTPLSFTTSGGQTTASLAGLTLNLSGAAAAGDSFNIVSGSREAAGTLSVALTSGSQIAAGLPSGKASAATANTGTATLAVSTAATDASPAGSTPLTAATTITTTATGLAFSPAVAVNLTSGGTTTTYAAGTPVPATAGATYTFGGVSVALTGTPAVGDSFTVTPTPGQSDGSNALNLVGLASDNLASGGTTTYSGAYSDFVNTIGNAATQTATASTAQTALVTQLTTQQQSVSGVDLNQEATNLLQYQQLYQANSKVIQMASSLFNTLLGAVSAG